MTILVIGGSGFLGQEVVGRALRSGWDVAATFLEHRPRIADARWYQLDIRQRPQIDSLFGRLQPPVVINAAYRQADWLTTANGAAYVAHASAAIGAKLVHVSSDVVFSGATIIYDETAEPDPISPYGAAKAAAEVAIATIDPSAVIARTSLILGYGRSAQEKFVRRLARGETDGVLFTDDIRCPVHVTDLAAALLELAAPGHRGIYHVAGADAVSRYEIGELIAGRDGLDAGRFRTGRRADTELTGPLDVRLDCRATQDRLNTRLRGAREFLQN